MSRTFEKKVREPLTLSPDQIILYAKPKMGKTDLVSRLEDCLIADMEEGSKYIKGYVESINSLQDLDALLTWLEQENPYKYVAFDTMTQLENWCVTEATLNYMNSGMGKNFNRVTKADILAGKAPKDKLNQPYPVGHEMFKSVLGLANGAGYQWLRESFEKWFNRMKRLPCRKIFICHIKDKFIQSKAGEEISGRELNLTGKIKFITASYADTIAYLNRGDDGNTYLSFISGEGVAEGSRSKHLTGRNILVGEWDAKAHDYKSTHWDKIYID